MPKSCWELISEFGEGKGKPRSPEVAMGENRGLRAFLAASWAPRLGCLSTMLGVGWGGGGGQQGHITYLSIILTDLFSTPAPSRKGMRPLSPPADPRRVSAGGPERSWFWCFWGTAEFKPTFTKYLSSDGAMKTSGVTGS